MVRDTIYGIHTEAKIPFDPLRRILYDLQVRCPTGHKREFRENRKRARRCNRGLNLHLPLIYIFVRLGRRSLRKIRKSEDLPHKVMSPRGSGTSTLHLW